MSRPLVLQEVFSSIQGEGLLVGVRQVFVRLFGCHLDCVYCDTPETKSVLQPKGFLPPRFRIEDPPGSQTFRSEANPVEPEAVRDLIVDLDRRFGPHHSIAITGGEPLLQAEGLVDLFPLLRERGLRVYLETAGDLVRQLSRVVLWVDWIAADIKLPSVSHDTDLFERHDAFLEVACASRAQVFAKCVVAADTQEEDLERAAELCMRHTVTLILQPVTSVAPEQKPPGAGQLLAWAVHLSRHGADVRVIPQLHKVLGYL
ncbi:MAG: 7-carboxy-7-deazaguanine synthase QueE [Fimbriimonadia bacterium]|jgi:organic radical activating enzyme